MTSVDAAVAEAHRAVREAITGSYDRRRFTVSKFGQHPDGYLHARVVVDGKPFYFHRRYGSWLAPGEISGRPVLKEPEALLGSGLGREVKYALSEKSHPLDVAERRAREAAEEARKLASKSHKSPSVAPDDSAGDDPPDGSDRVLVGVHPADADEAIRPDDIGG